MFLEEDKSERQIERKKMKAFESDKPYTVRTETLAFHFFFLLVHIQERAGSYFLI